MYMLKYILGPQGTYEEVVRKNPSKAIKKQKLKKASRSYDGLLRMRKIVEVKYLICWD